MPAARSAIDPLWQCLCPAWTQFSALRGPYVLSPPRRPALRCLGAPSRARQESFVAREVAQSRPLHTSYEPVSGAKSRERHDGRILGRKGAGAGSPQQQPPTGIQNIEQESTYFLYGQLRSTAIEGQFHRCRAIAEYLVKERREKPSVQLYNALILVNISHDRGSAWRVAELLEEMQAESLQPDVGTCHAVLKVCAVHLDHLLRADTLDFMKKRWYTLSDDGAHDVVAGMLRDGLFEQALDRLDGMRREGSRIDGWLEDMAIYMLCDAGEIDEAYRLMRIRYDAGNLNLSRSLYIHLLDKGSEARHHDATSFVWTSQVNQGYLNPPSGVCLNVLTTAARSGDATLGTDVFAHLSKRGTAFQPIHFELLISTYLSANPPDLVRALSILTIMPLEKLTPTVAETRSLYLYLKDKPIQVHQAFDSLRELHEEGRTIPIAALNLLVECYVEQRDLLEAMKIYKLIHTFAPIGQGAQKTFANIETFNLLFKGCRNATPPDAGQASFLVSELLALRIVPTALTYDRLILVFLEAANAALDETPPTISAPESEPDANLKPDSSARMQLLDYAFRHFADMQPLGWVPRFGTVELLAVRLAEAGDERCWDVLQVAEDQGEEFAAYDAKGKWMRRNVETAWGKAVGIPDEELGHPEGVQGVSTGIGTSQVDSAG